MPLGTALILLLAVVSERLPGEQKATMTAYCCVPTALETLGGMSTGAFSPQNRIALNAEHIVDAQSSSLLPATGCVDCGHVPVVLYRLKTRPHITTSSLDLRMCGINSAY